MKDNAFHQSTYGTMNYIIRNGVCHFSIKRRGLEQTLSKVAAYNAKKSSKTTSTFDSSLFISSRIEEDEDLLKFFLMTYFTSEEFTRDKYFSHKFNSQNVSDLEILADILMCVDHNKGDTTSRINYDSDGVRTSINIFEKKKGIARMFSSSDEGKFVTTLPLSNVSALIAENTSVTFRMQNGQLVRYGNSSTVQQ